MWFLLNLPICGKRLNECVASLNPNPVTLSGVTIEWYPWTCRATSLKVVESLSACVCGVCVCLFRSSPTPGEQNRGVYMVNTNNIHQHHFSFRWLAVMSSTSKACFICGVSGNKGFSKYGKQTLDSVQTRLYLWNLCHALLQSHHPTARYVCIYCVLCMNVADLNSYPGDIHKNTMSCTIKILWCMYCINVNKREIWDFK